MKKGKSRIALPLAEWPERDRTVWLEAQRMGGRLTRPGAAARLAPATRAMMAYTYGTYLAWLRSCGDLDPKAAPETRVTFERLSMFLEERRRLSSDNTVQGHLAMMVMMLHCIAPGGSWTWVRHHPAAPHRRDARSARKRPCVFDPAMAVNRLMEDMKRLLMKPIDRRTAIQFRDDLMVAVAVFTGLRRRNLLGMCLERNLVRHRSVWTLNFESGEVKNSVPLAMPWPAPLVPALEHFLSHVRPILTGGADAAGGPVFPARSGKALTEPGFQLAFARTTVRTFGHKINAQRCAIPAPRC